MVNPINSRIYKKLIKLVPELWLLELGAGLKSCSKGYIDLHLDVLSEEEEMTIALSHYYQSESRDLVSDPDMEVLIFRKGMAEALTYQDEFTFQHIYADKTHFYSKIKKELNSFLNYWLRNCLKQGHRLERERRKLN